MYLNPIEVQLVIEFQKKYMYPKNRTEFFDCLKKLEEDPLNVEIILAKCHRMTHSLSDYFKEYTDDRIDSIIAYIV